MYALLVDTEKDISMDLLLGIIEAQYDPNNKKGPTESGRVELSETFPADSNFYFYTSTTGIHNNKIFSEALATPNEQMNAFTGIYDTVQNLKDPSQVPGNYDSAYRTPQINY